MLCGFSKSINYHEPFKGWPYHFHVEVVVCIFGSCFFSVKLVGVTIHVGICYNA